ncbi:MAG: S8 family serine peptidase [bacterium]
MVFVRCLGGVFSAFLITGIAGAAGGASSVGPPRSPGQTLSIGAAPPGAGPAKSLSSEPAHVPGRLIVVFREGVSLQARRDAHRLVAAREWRTLVHPRMELALFDSSADLSRLEAGLRTDPDVELVQPDYLGKGGSAPNDTFYGEQWHLNNTGQSGGTPGADIEAEAGWDIASGSNSVVVAVLDTGIDSDHPEFAGRILPGWDFVNDDADPEDDFGHGTLVTGLLAANADNAFSVSGVDHACMILPVKVLDQFNSGTTSNLISGLGFAVAGHADVISMSLINYPCGGALEDALSDAELSGAILVACAGNGGIGDADVSCPGASIHSMSIGVTGDNDARASYSGTGDALDFVAPGHVVRSVVYNSFDDGFQIFSGCSAATPVAAGIVSILRALGPELRTPEVRAILQATAEDLVGAPEEDTPGWDPFMGYGRLNLRAALQYFVGATGAPRAEVRGEGDLRVDARPNPVRGPVTIRFTLPAEAWAKVSIFDVQGRLVRTLLEGLRGAGGHDVAWDGTDGGGHPTAPGVYFARVAADGRSALQKVTVLR